MDDPRLWDGFAGRTPVTLHFEDNPVSPFEGYGGGDGFDLETLGDDAADGVRFIRLQSAGTSVDPRTGTFYPIDPISNGPDIDGVIGRSLDPSSD